jgi:4-diphosphocytidyl-2-C-methyl-D-erythritol kinase
VVLLKPAFGVDTAWAYTHWQDSTSLPGIRHEAQAIGGLTLVNDLERPVFSKFIFLAELKHWLLDRAEVAAALMCGSGSTMLAVLTDPGAAAAVIAAARHELDPILWAWSGSIGK